MQAKQDLASGNYKQLNKANSLKLYVELYLISQKPDF